MPVSRGTRPSSRRATGRASQSSRTSRASGAPKQRKYEVAAGISAGGDSREGELDPQADDATRAKLVADTRASIEAQGELLRHDDWGERALAYPIDRKSSAQYHLLQFHVANVELLGGLDRTLRLADGADEVHRDQVGRLEIAKYN